MYGRGDGVPKNEEIAMEWIRRAAEAGNEAAINILKQE
jgi:TPR repeat protein